MTYPRSILEWLAWIILAIAWEACALLPLWGAEEIPTPRPEPWAGDWGLPEGTPIDKGPYVFAYDARAHNPAWTAYVLTGKKRKKPVERPESFHAEDLLPQSLRARTVDYKGILRLGINEGHRFPFACALDDKAAYESMSLANVIPQDADNNQNIYGKKIEPAAMAMAEEGRYLAYVVDTQTYPEAVKHRVTIKTIGPDNVWVPAVLFKAVMVVDEQTRQPLGQRNWALSNEPYPHDTPEESFRLSTAEVQDQTGYDLWPCVPQPLQDQLESSK